MVALWFPLLALAAKQGGSRDVYREKNAQVARVQSKFGMFYI